MKKIYFAAAVLAANFSMAQTTVTFEDMTLAPESYYNGADSVGGFTSGGVFFENTFSGYWSNGFAYSNTTDVTTAGYTNDFSAYAGGGANGSTNYSVNYGGNIDFGTQALVSSIDITNNTYAALSMLNGDLFAKQFGSTVDANGDVDGTNGEDWFRLLIVGRNGSSVITDTVVFYLADYRFADNNDDYIIDSWETVDLTSLGAVRYLEFTLESSDEGDWGMNTPAYFALDDLIYGSLSLNETVANNLTVYPNPASETITFKGTEGKITITSLTGSIVFAGELTGLNAVNVSEFTNGAYVYSIETAAGIINGRFVKQN